MLCIRSPRHLLVGVGIGVALAVLARASRRRAGAVLERAWGALDVPTATRCPGCLGDEARDRWAHAG